MSLDKYVSRREVLRYLIGIPFTLGLGSGAINCQEIQQSEKGSSVYEILNPRDNSYLGKSDVVGSFSLLAREGSESLDAIVLRLIGDGFDDLRVFTRMDQRHFDERHFRREKDEKGRDVVRALPTNCYHSEFLEQRVKEGTVYNFGIDPQGLQDGNYRAQFWVKQVGRWRNDGQKKRLDRYLKLIKTEILKVMEECEFYLECKFKVDNESPGASTLETSDKYMKILFYDNSGMRENGLRVIRLTDDIENITDRVNLRSEVKGSDMVVELRDYPCDKEDVVVSCLDVAGNSILYSPFISKEELEKRIRKINIGKMERILRRKVENGSDSGVRKSGLEFLKRILKEGEG